MNRNPLFLLILAVLVSAYFLYNTLKISQKEREEHTKLQAEHLLLIAKVKDLERSVDIEEIKNVDGSSKKTIKIREKSQEIVKINEKNTIKQDTKIKEKYEERHLVGLGMGISSSLNQVYNATYIAPPIFGVRPYIFGNTDTKEHSVGIGLMGRF